MTEATLQRLAVDLANIGDSYCLDTLLKSHPGGRPDSWRGMLAVTHQERYPGNPGLLAPVVFTLQTAPYVMDRHPVCLMPVRATTKTSSGTAPLHFGGSRDILAHAMFAAKKEEDGNVALYGNLPHVGLNQVDGTLASLASAGLASFLAGYAELTGLALPGWVACTGVLRTTAHPGILPPVGEVKYIWDKYQAMVQANVPEISLILMPSSNESELLDKLGKTDLDPRVKFVATLQEAVDAIWGAAPNRRLGELPIRDQVRHLEAEWFHAPYSPAHQEAVLGDADRLLRQHAQSDTLSAMEQVVCLTIKGHYHSHRGEETLAQTLLQQAWKIAETDQQSPTPTLDLARAIRLQNALAVTHLGRLDPQTALIELDRCSDAQLRLAGEEGLFHKGTRGQALSLMGAHLLACGKPQEAGVHLRQSVDLHRSLIDAKQDPARHRCYAARALALLGDFDQALALLGLPKAWECALQADVPPAAPDDLWLRGLSTAPDGFTLLRVAHLCWATNQPQKWLNLCGHLARTAPDSGPVPDEFRWPYFGIALQHAVNLAECGYVEQAKTLLSVLHTQVSRAEDGHPKRELPLLYCSCAQIRVAALDGPDLGALRAVLDGLGSQSQEWPMQQVLAPIHLALASEPLRLQPATRAAWAAALY